MKQALIAVGVFAALLVVVLATRDNGNVNVGVPKLELPVVDGEKVTSIEIAGALTVSLKKESAGWTVADASKVPHVADPAQITSLLESLKAFKAEDFITERTERLAELEVDDAKGLAVKVFTQGASPALDVVIGKAAKNGGAYLKAAKGSQVFVTRGQLAQLARHQATHWRKRSIYPAKPDELAKVTVKHEDGQTLALELTDGGTWALPASTPPAPGYRFDPAAAQRIAGSLASTWAIEFLDKPAEELFKGPTTTVEAQLKDGKSVVMHVGQSVAAVTDGGQPSQAGVAAQLDGDAQVYVISNDQAAQLKKHVGDLRDTSLASFDPAKAQKLVIQAGGKKTVLAREGQSWKVIEPKVIPVGFEFDPGQVMAQLAMLRQLRAASVADGVAEAAAGLAKPTASAEISIEGGPAQTIKFGGETPNKQLYVKGAVDGLVYAIDSGYRIQLERGLELFKKPPAPPPGMGMPRGMENLPPDIRKQLEAQLRQRQGG